MIRGVDIMDDKKNERAMIMMRIVEQLSYLEGTETKDIVRLVYDINELCGELISSCGEPCLEWLKPIYKKHYNQLKDIIEKGDVIRVQYNYNDGHIYTANVLSVLTNFKEPITLDLRYGNGETFIDNVVGECLFECILDCGEIVDVFVDGDYVGTLNYNHE